MVDLSKIRIGDEVTVRCIVKEIAANDKDLVVVKPSNNPGKYFTDMCISKDWIATHTPKPRPFKLGDRVTWGSGRAVYEFIAQRGGVAIVWSHDFGLSDPDISELRHADKN